MHSKLVKNILIKSSKIFVKKKLIENKNNYCNNGQDTVLK